MSAWAQGRLYAADTETDGPNPEDARIITATVLGLGGGQERTARQWLLKPERPIPEGATAVHGITTEYATEHGTERAAAIDDIAGEIACVFVNELPLIVFNAAFDLTVLDRECRRVGVSTVADRLKPGAPFGPVIDPYVIDKQVDRFRRGKRTLGVMCELYGIDLGNAHDATADALGAARLAYKLAARYPQVGEMSALDLHAAQVGWRAEQQASLGEYFAKQGKSERVDGRWPLIPADRAEVAR